MTALGLSDLQFALALIGLLILVFVAVVNIKYARARHNSKVGQSSLVREPSFGAGFAETGERIQSTLGDAKLSPSSIPEAYSIDPCIDCVITLRFDEGISGAEILEEMKTWADELSASAARWMCEGLNSDVDAAEEWEDLRPEASYSELQLAIQLASRRGPIGVLDLSDFCSRTQLLAETLGSQIDMPSVSTMLEKAKDLDAMAAESDFQLSINVLFDEVRSWPSFDVLMRQRGFILSRNGLTYQYFSNRVPIFSTNDLNSDRPVEQVTLLLELPLIACEENAFERMLVESLEIARLAHGRLVDDNGTNLTETSIQSIRQHLDGLYENLEKSGVPAGSSAASRLFS
jgi:hypothetical protein